MAISACISESDLSSAGLSEKKKLKLWSSQYVLYKSYLKDSALLLFSTLRTLGLPSSLVPFLLTSKQYTAFGLFPSARLPISWFSSGVLLNDFSVGIHCEKMTEKSYPPMPTRQ